MIGLSNALPINKDAYRIIKKAKRDDVWENPYKAPATASFSKNVLKVVKPTKSIVVNGVYEKLIGKRRGKMVIVGLAPKTNGPGECGRWVCRCDCGNYETRRTPERWLKVEHSDSCQECQKRDYLMRSGKF
jgi:hypothetical protein